MPAKVQTKWVIPVLVQRLIVNLTFKAHTRGRLSLFHKSAYESASLDHLDLEGIASLYGPLLKDHRA
jgi:hypothetical protein